MADSVGNHTYGTEHLQIKRWDNKYNQRRKVNIGKFCSIAPNVTIITNGNHKYERATTYPFAELGWIPMNDETCSAYGNGDVNIGNDVWIGMNSTIISGITVGDGAIIATNSCVVKDVPPYSVVGGNPAKLIKYRFDQETIDSLLKIKWWDWNVDKIKESLPLLLKDDQCKDFIKKYL